MAEYQMDITITTPKPLKPPEISEIFNEVDKVIARVAIIIWYCIYVHLSICCLWSMNKLAAQDQLQLAEGLGGVCYKTNVR